MQPLARPRRRLGPGIIVLLAWILGALLAPVAWASEPFPTHAPLSRSVPGAQNLGTGLASGQQLGANQYLLAGNGQYELDMFADGVGVLWNLPPGANACPMWIFPGISNNVMSNYPWTPSTTPVPGAYLVMQDDGNFVQYPAPGQAAQWASGTNGNAGATLALQDDGNLVVYQNSNAIWATSTNNYRGPVLCQGNTLQPNQGLVESTFMSNPFAVNDANAGDAPFHLLVNTDGNLEMLSQDFPVYLCCSKNDLVPGSFLIMQGDGNLVFYAPDGGPALWASGTAGNPGAVAIMSNWGGVWVVDPVSGLILYDSEGKYQGEVVGNFTFTFIPLYH